jgi:hypothetical protein
MTLYYIEIIHKTKQSHMASSNFVVGEVPVQVLSPEGGALESVSPRGCSQTLEKCTSTGTSPCVNNSLFISSLLSHFVEKKYFHGNIETYKIGGISPSITP